PTAEPGRPNADGAMPAVPGQTRGAETGSLDRNSRPDVNRLRGQAVHDISPLVGGVLTVDPGLGDDLVIAGLRKNLSRKEPVIFDRLEKFLECAGRVVPIDRLLPFADRALDVRGRHRFDPVDSVINALLEVCLDDLDGRLTCCRA